MGTWLNKCVNNSFKMYFVVWLLFGNVFQYCLSLNYTEDVPAFTFSSTNEIARHIFENCETVVVTVPNVVLNTSSYIVGLDQPVEMLSYDYILDNCEGLKKKHLTTGYFFVIENLDTESYKTMECVRQTAVFPAEVDFLIVDVAPPTFNILTKYTVFLSTLWNELSLTRVVILPVNSNSISSPRAHILNPFLQKLEYSQQCFDDVESDCSKIINNVSLDDRIPSVMADRFKNMNSHVVHFFSTDLEDLPVTHSLWRLKKELESYFCLEIEYHTFSLISGEEILRVLDDNMTNGKVDDGESIYYVEGCMEFHSTSFSFSHPEGMKKRVRFAISMYETPVGFLVHKGSPIESWKIFFYIFQLEVWICTFVAFLVFNLAWILLKMLTGSNFQHVRESIFQICVSVGKTIFSVQLNNVPTSFPERILLASCFLLGIVLMTLFTSQVFSLTTSKPYRPPIGSLRELVKYVLDSQLHVTTKYIENVTDFFNGTVVAPLIPRLVQDNVAVGQLIDLGKLDVLEKTENPLFTVVTPPIVTSVSKSNDSGIYLAKEPFQLVHCNLFTSFKWGKYYNLFNMFTTQCFQYGLVRKWDKDYLLFNGVFDENKLKSFGKTALVDDIHEPLSYTMLLFPFYTLYVGCAISCIVFVLEILFARKYEYKN